MRVHSTVRRGSRCFVDQDAIVEKECVLGDDCRIAPHVTVFAGTTLGDRVEFDDGSKASGAVLADDDCKIKMHAVFGQGSIMEEKCWLGPFAILIHEVHAHHHQPREKVSRGCYLHAGATIGAHAAIVSGVTIGYNAEIGAHAIVTKDCEPNGIYINCAHDLKRTWKERLWSWPWRPWRATKPGPVYAERVGTVPPSRRVAVPDHREPLMFSAEILEKYLPHLERVGKYAVRR